MKPFALYCSLLTLLASCSQKAIYQSPVHLKTSTYKPIPLKSEGIPSATYAGISLAAGGSNHQYHDDIYNITGTFHRSHNFGSFQATYGANVLLGSYHVNAYQPLDSPTRFNSQAFDRLAINERSGGKFFGAWGVNGSINVVAPIGMGEWRIFGAEASWTNEFGDYLRFRQKLPHGTATYVDRQQNFFTYGIFTDMIFELNSTQSLGFKLALLGSPEKIENDRSVSSDAVTYYQPAYFSQTVHLTLDRVSLYAQWNIGSYAMNFQTGLSLRLSHIKKAGNAAGL